MATPALISVSEYLNTSYRPDCDYIDGEVLERNLGERSHALLQGILFSLCEASQEEWNLLSLLEQRVQVSDTRFRVPDICLVEPTESDEIVRKPPVLCIEILSRDDNLHSMQRRVDDYLGMGIPNIWLLDPVLRRAWSASSTGLQGVETTLLIPGTVVSVNLEQVFTRLEHLLAGRLKRR